MLNKLKEKYYRRRGQKYLSSRQSSKARKFLLKSFELNDSAENMFNLALSYMSLFQYQEAENYLRRIYVLHPENEINILAYIESLLMQRKWSDLEQIIADQHKNFSSSNSFNKYADIINNPVEREKYTASKEKIMTGFQQLDKGNKEDALQDFLKAVDYFEKDPALLQNIGLLYFDTEKFDQAYKFFEKALTILPGELQLQKLLIKTKKKLPSKL
ncbi:tetratricopeptide repeat protein [Candidatus Cloacimonadota bacterium]